MSDNFQHLKRWTIPNYYWGADWPQYFVFLGRHRESDHLTRWNFQEGSRELGGESETVKIVRESCSLVGWVQWIDIHESDTQSLARAEELLGELSDYPILNELGFSDYEFELAADYWAELSVRDRMQYLREAGLSIFSARRDYFPAHDDGMIFERITQNGL